ncbi:MAG: MFS transporter [Candidatus Omnitrophica bacterium]|nr:MFS transporter [Candidatus Omnitrophota bacterium]
MLQFYRKHSALLTFGILQYFFSAPGQTFLISLFFTPIFDELGLSQTANAGIYSSATLLASFFLIPAGHLIDKYSIFRVIKTATISMAIACILLAFAHNLIALFIAFFLLRLFGQGLFGLISSTLMIKKFHKNRGKALGIITLGFPFSEGAYPFIAIFLLTQFGWRTTYLFFAFSYLLLMLPIQIYLLNKAQVKHDEFLEGETTPLHTSQQTIKQQKIHHFTVKDIVKDIRFYILLLASCLPPMVLTGLFFHQQTLFNANQWNIELAASGILAYAIAKALGSVFIGPLIDKYGALTPFVLLILLLGVGAEIASFGGHEINIYVYFTIIGVSLGFSSPVSNVVWPHFFGVKHMGSIKGLIGMFRNGLTALGPLPVAMALDAGISINKILNWFGIATMFCAFLPLIAWQWKVKEKN